MKTDKMTWIFFIIILVGISGGILHILRLNNVFVAKVPSTINSESSTEVIVCLDSQEKVKNKRIAHISPISSIRPIKLISPTKPIKLIKKQGLPTNIKTKLELANGSLLVKSNPEGAIVYLDGEEKGKTPLNIPELHPLHPYRLQLSLDKYDDWQANIFVEEGEEVKIEANLKAKQEGFIYITSIPAASAVYLDDKLIGETPLREFTLKPSDYTIKISHEGYLTQTRKITVLPNEGVFMNFELIK